jgi:predicted ATPase
LAEIYRCAQEGSQFFIASHSPILTGMPGAGILQFDDGPLHYCNYEDTDSYQVTNMFIENKDYLLKRLLEE